MKNISSRVSDEFYEWLQMMAEREDTNMSKIIFYLLDRMRIILNIEKELEMK